MRRLSLLSLFVLLLSWQTTAQQNSPIVLTVQFMEGLNYLSNSSLFEDFEAAHPGVEVNVVYKPIDFEADYILSPWYDLEAHLDGMDRYTVQADVLMMSVGEGFTELSLEATRAGYVLNLLPHFNADSTSDPSVYYPTAWQSAQWDGGLWLLPTSTVISGIVYDADAFDAAGLTHPNENWTPAEFAHAAEVLAPRDAAGNVIEPAYMGMNGNDGALVYHYLEQPLYDTNEFPYPPAFVRDETIELANQWLPALASGAMFNFQHDYPESLRLDHLALSVKWLSIAYLNDLQIAPMPGGGGLVNINGLAVSGRTEYPQLAYELAAYLAADRRVADAMSNSWGGMTLARPEYGEVINGAGTPRMMEQEGETYEQALLIMDAALHEGIPASELLYYEYFRDALFYAAEGQDIETALRDAEVLANNNLAIAEARREAMVGTIPTPIPEVELAPGEIELSFYYQEGDTLLWQSFSQEFIDADPEVGRIVLKTISDGTDYRREGTDCFYLNGSVAQTGSEYFLDLAPLLAADASLNPDDWLAGVFDSVQVENSIYAMPIDIRPLALWYDPEQIEMANLQLPETSSEFLDTLNQLNSPALSSYQLGTSLLMLMAAQGTIPINYESDPIQIDFTSEATMAGIQQILDLAREGKIKYGSIIDFDNEGFPDREAFVMDYVADSMFRDAAYLPLAFPAGEEYTPVNYQMMVGYISRSSQYPEACYRLLRAVAQSPELLNGIPALRSEALNSDYATFFEVINQQLEAPNRLFISSLDSQEDYYATYWLFLAFDRYVLEDANLLTELTVAEIHTSDFLTCLQRGESSTYECALATDPSLSS